MIRNTNENNLQPLLQFNEQLGELNKNIRKFCFNRSFKITPLPCKKQATVSEVMLELSTRIDRVKTAKLNLQISSEKWEIIKNNILQYINSKCTTKDDSVKFNKLKTKIDQCKILSKIQELLSKPTATLTTNESKFLIKYCQNKAHELQVLRNIICYDITLFIKLLVGKELESNGFVLLEVTEGNKQSHLLTLSDDLTEEETILSMDCTAKIANCNVIPGAFAYLIKQLENLDPQYQRIVKLWILLSGVYAVDGLSEFFYSLPLAGLTFEGTILDPAAMSREALEIIIMKQVEHPTAKFLRTQLESVLSVKSFSRYNDSLAATVEEYLRTVNIVEMKQTYAEIYQKIQEYFELQGSSLTTDLKDDVSKLPIPEIFQKLTIPVVKSKDIISKCTEHFIENVKSFCHQENADFYSFIRSIIFEKSNYLEFEKDFGREWLATSKHNYKLKKDIEGVDEESDTQTIITINKDIEEVDKEPDTQRIITQESKNSGIDQKAPPSILDLLKNLELNDKENSHTTVAVDQLANENFNKKPELEKKKKKNKNKDTENVTPNSINRNSPVSLDINTESRGLIETQASTIPETIPNSSNHSLVIPSKEEIEPQSQTLIETEIPDVSEIEPDSINPSHVDSSKEEINTQNDSAEWEVAVSKNSKSKFSPKSFNEFINKISLDKRVNDLFINPDEAIDKEERFKFLSKETKEKIKLFKQYPGIITYYTLTRGIEGKITSEKSKKTQSCFFAIGTITPYDEHGTPLTTYKGVFTDAFDKSNPTHLYHHSFTEKQYNKILMEYSAKGYMEEATLSELVADTLNIGSNPDFTADLGRFKVTDIPLGVIVDDTVKRIRYKLCFPIENKS